MIAIFYVLFALAVCFAVAVGFIIAAILMVHFILCPFIDWLEGEY